MNTALKNIRRSPYQALAAIGVNSLTVFVVGVFSLLMIGSHLVLTAFESKPQLIAYLKDTHTKEQVDTLTKALKDTGLTKSTTYISKNDALEIYKKSVGNDPLLLGSVTDLGLITADILPASLEVTALSPDKFPDLVAIIQKSDIISTTPKGQKEIDFPQDVVSELTRWTNGIRTAGLALITILVINSIITIMIIISMKIAAKRVEIGTMKLLGAKSNFILKPYLVESSLYGFFGAIVGWLATIIALLYSTPFLAPRLVGMIDFPVNWLALGLLLAVMIVVFVILGFFSGLLAAARFLKR